MEYKYTIFETEWGYFGLFGTDKAVFRSCLPVRSKEKCRNTLLDGVDNAVVDNRCFTKATDLVKYYYEGNYVDLRSIKVDVDNKTDFSRAILKKLRQVRQGKVVTYAQLAEMAGRPKAGRAVGTVLAKNPVPLIIPCHRVIRSDGKMGGFSAAGGVLVKEKMLGMEAETDKK